MTEMTKLPRRRPEYGLKLSGILQKLTINLTNFGKYQNYNFKRASDQT